MAAEAAAEAASRNRDDPQFDPLATVHGHSVGIDEVLGYRGMGDRPFVSDNVAALLKAAAAFARPATSPPAGALVQPAHMWRAMMARAFAAEKGGFAADLSRANREGIFSRLLESEKQEEDQLVANTPPPVTADDLLDWQSVEVLAKASALRRETNTKFVELGQRHLALALFATREGQSALRDMGGFATGYEAFRTALVAAFTPDKYIALGDDEAAWRRILAGIAVAPPLVDRIERRPNYLNDRVRIAPPGQLGQEPLGAAEDARALADLMLLEAAEPPIAIGLFGPWGSGKSTLIEHLKSEIARQTRIERAARKDGVPSDEETRIVGNVVQLSFNAWTFADSTNLWATLTSEIFDQLAAGGWIEQTDAEGKVQDSDPKIRVAAAALVSEVAARTTREIASLRVAKVTVKEKDLAIKAANEVLEQAQKDKRASFSLAVADAASDLKGSDAVAGHESLRQLLGWSFAKGWKRAFLVALGLGILALIGWWASRQWPSPATIWPAIISGLSAAVALVWPFVRAFLSVVHHWNERKAAADQAIARAATELRERQAALAAAEQQRDRSQSFLATYGMDQGADSATAPMKMLDYLLHESEAVAAIRAQTGLLATVRRCFEQLQAVIRSNKRPATPGGSPPANAIDRIILYIDDLDRCSTQQVSLILQAVHLLLSFDCFVVVVAADANWLKQSLEEQHPRLFGEKSQLTPADYLEKIFQIPFWVRPLVDVDAEDDKRFRLYESYVDHLLRDEEEVTPPAAPAAAEQSDGAREPTGSGSFTPRGTARTETRAAPRRERIRLSPPEKEAIKQLGPLAAKSPRAVKRLINIYRLMRVRLEGAALEAFLGAGNAEVPAFRAVLFALACEVGLPALTMAVTGESLARLSDLDWKRMRGKLAEDAPAIRLNANGSGQPYAVLEAAGRVEDFLRTIAVVDGIEDPRQLHMALEEVRRYSFRPL